MPRRKANPNAPTTPFVVYVTYPNGSKEYAYLCKDPNVRQGSTVYGNDWAMCKVVRTAAMDPIATRYVVSKEVANRNVRIRDIMESLERLEKAETLLTKWSKLKSPEAKKLVAELKRLSNEN